MKIRWIKLIDGTVLQVVTHIDPATGKLQHKSYDELGRKYMENMDESIFLLDDDGYMTEEFDVFDTREEAEASTTI